jgi:hypothetical protein
VHTTLHRDFTLLLSLCYSDCAFTIQEFIETLECIIPLVYHLDSIMMENLLGVLCLIDRTLVEVEWQVPLMRFRALYTLVHEWKVWESE